MLAVTGNRERSVEAHRIPKCSGTTEFKGNTTVMSWGRSIKDTLVAAVKGSMKDNLLHWAAAIAYYASLSFAPLLLVILIGISFFADAEWAASRLSTILGNFLPDESQQQLRDFVNHAVQSRGRLGALSVVAFLYTGTRVFASLTRALHVIYDQEEERQFFRELAAQVIMLFTLGGVFLLALSSRFFFGLLSGAVEFLPSGEEQIVQRLVGGGIQILMLFGAFALIYRFIPSNEESWRPPITGAIVATTLFVIVRPLFIFYLDRFGNQEIVYGSLASLVVLLLWIWISAIITLFGGEVADATRQRGSLAA